MGYSIPQTEEDSLDFELTERPISLGSIVARKLIEKSMTQEVHPNNITPQMLLADTELHYMHQAFHAELQSAIAQSKYIHPSMSVTLHVKALGTIRREDSSNSKTLATIQHYVGDRKIESRVHVMWNANEHVIEICINVKGGIPAPSILKCCMEKAWKDFSISGDIISLKYQSMTGNTWSGLEENKPLIHEGIWEHSVDRSEWIQFRPFWKRSGITDPEVRKYIHTCTRIVYNRLMNIYNPAGRHEVAVPHLVTYVFKDATIMEAFSCPCNLYKCRGLRENPGRSCRICPFVGNELHPHGSISFI